MQTGFEYTAYNDIAELKKTVKRINSAAPFGLRKKQRLAAILLEPLQGEGGITPGDKVRRAACRPRTCPRPRFGAKVA